MNSCQQKSPIQGEGGGESNNLNAINKKILEIKKKIQLAEGQKKAYTEELELESKNNQKRIAQLKKEMKVLLGEVNSAKLEVGGERYFRLAKYLHQLGPVANKDHKQLKEVLDLRVIDLHKQLDVLRYKRRKRRGELERLEGEYQKCARDGLNATSRPGTEDNVSRKTVSHLENEIHRFTVQWMEAEHIRKKYSGIRYSLLNDSVKFESALKKVEDMIKQQNDEIIKLQEVNKCAIQMRDGAMATLMQEEQRVLRSVGEREAVLAVARRRLANRRADLERLERRIFPQGRGAVVVQDSLGSTDLPPVEEEPPDMLGGYQMEQIFQKLMKATGVSDPEHVFERFKAQQSTLQRLQYLRDTTERDKRQAEEDQNLILAEMEAYKFAQVKDKEENQEEMERLKREIEIQLEQRDAYELENRQITDVLLDIKRSFYDCCMKLEDADDTLVPDWTDDTSNLEDIFDLLKQKYLAASLIIQEILPETVETPGETDKKETESVQAPPPLEKVMSEERSSLPVAYRELLAPRTKSRSTATPSGAKQPASDEEDEIPSRGFLKRQAQLIVDTKSRRKGYRQPART